jgi:hypothetical protein
VSTVEISGKRKGHDAHIGGCAGSQPWSTRAFLLSGVFYPAEIDLRQLEFGWPREPHLLV